MKELFAYNVTELSSDIYERFIHNDRMAILSTPVNYDDRESGRVKINSIFTLKNVLFLNFRNNLPLI